MSERETSIFNFGLSKKFTAAKTENCGKLRSAGIVFLIAKKTESASDAVPFFRKQTLSAECRQSHRAAGIVFFACKKNRVASDAEPFFASKRYRLNADSRIGRQAKYRIAKCEASVVRVRNFAKNRHCSPVTVLFRGAFYAMIVAGENKLNINRRRVEKKQRTNCFV